MKGSFMKKSSLLMIVIILISIFSINYLKVMASTIADCSGKKPECAPPHIVKEYDCRSMICGGTVPEKTCYVCE